MKVNQFTLKNGLNVFLVPQKEASSVAVELLVRAGSKHEEKGTEGLAHFLEHAVAKGTKKWPTARQIAKVIDSAGAVYNAYTGKEATGYWMKAAPEHLELALELISQELLFPLLREKDIKTERGVIIEELNMYEDRPMDKVEDFFEAQLLGSNALGRSIIGKKKSLLALKQKDFKNFRKNWYRADRMSLSLVGAIKNASQAKNLVKKYFSSLLAKSKPEPKVKIIPAKKDVFWQRKKTEQTHFQIGLPAVGANNPKKWPGKVLTAVLGQGMSSRLFAKIREERGWAYYIHSFQVNYLPAGFLAVKAGVKNETAKQAINLVKKEFEKIKNNLTQEEVKRVKSMFKGRSLISFESPITIANLLNRGWLFEREIYTPQKVINKGEAVTYSQVRDFANEFINLKNLRLAVIGPLGK